MKTVLLLGFIALAAAAPKGAKLGFRNLYKEPIIPIPENRQPRIIGGQEAAPNSIPWQAFLEVYSIYEGWYCGGTLISENYVLTSANCADAAQAYVTLGAHNPRAHEDTSVTIYSPNLTVNSLWDKVNFVNDIGVILLPGGVNLTEAIQPVLLPTRADVANTYEGANAITSGWGITIGHGSTLSDVLNYVDLEIISNALCEQVFGPLAPTVLCTSGLENTSPCYGDSGGPLTVDDTLVGIYSFSIQYCPGSYPTGYTRVADYLSWIQSHTDVVIQ